MVCHCENLKISIENQQWEHAIDIFYSVDTHSMK